MDIVAAISEAVRDSLPALAAEAGGEEAAGFQINLFWVITQAVSFLLFLAILYLVAFKRIGGTLEERRQRIEQGLKDAEQARRDRDSAEQERVETLAEARREANEILARAQKVAQETREADIAATREELDRMRIRATTEIDAEKQRAIGELRGEVADLALAAAGRVVGETMSDPRQRRLVEEFIATTPTSDGSSR